MAFFILVYFPWGLSSGILGVGPAGWYIPDGPGGIYGVGPGSPVVILGQDPSDAGGNLGPFGPVGILGVGPGWILEVGPAVGPAWLYIPVVDPGGILGVGLAVGPAGLYIPVVGPAGWYIPVGPGGILGVGPGGSGWNLDSADSPSHLTVMSPVTYFHCVSLSKNCHCLMSSGHVSVPTLLTQP